MHSLLKFIENEERGVSSDLKIKPPKCFENFEALKIFRSILKNKIVYIGHMPEGSILKKILNSNEKENVLDSEEEEIMKDEGDVRK